MVGTTNIDGAGASGVEMKFDDSLQGVPGRSGLSKICMVTPSGTLVLSAKLTGEPTVKYRFATPARPTSRAASGNERNRGRCCFGVTVDAHTGEILAMTNLPSFNPNRRGQLNLAAMRNRVVTDVYEPGSTVKPLTLVAALESGEFDIDTIIDTSPGRIKVGDKVLPDPRNYGPISVSRVIEKSSQVGVTKMAQAVGHESIIDVFQRFGLGQATGQSFPVSAPVGSRITTLECD